ncbi:conserved protein of unknown function [Hyphomicrobium sp. 1Nfss2.1]|uniref:hypothetical protein n=1 Tax=Hyphomicrobium sp. 1Nfss2.1 TaxID=3413936 RepID=UPI003C7B41CE
MAANQRSGGLVRLATDIAQQGHVEVMPSSGAGESVAGLSRHFAGIGAQIGQMADVASAEEGEAAGRLAGLDPEFRPTKSLTIRGQAYDRAGMQVASTRLKQGMEGDLAAAYDALQNDPAKLDAELDKKGASWVSQAPPEVRPAMEQALRGAKITYMRQAARAQIERVYNEQQAAVQTEVGDGLKTMHQRAYNLGLDAEADRIMADGVAHLDGVLARTDVTGKRLIEPEAAARVHADALETISTARLTGAFDRLKTVGEKEKFIAQFEDDFANSRGLAKQYDLAGFQKVSGLLRADLTRTKTEGAVAVRALDEETKSIVTMLKKGGAVPADQVAGLEARASAAGGGSPALQQNIAEVKGLVRYQQAVRMMPPAELDRVLTMQRDKIAKDGATPYAVAELDLGEDLQRNMRTRLKEDPNGWANDVGRLTVAPLDFSSPQAATATLQARIAQAEEVGAAYGQQPQYFRPDERRALSALAGQGGGQSLAIATTIASVAGERAPRMLAELFNEAPATAMLGGLVAAAGPTPVARDAADGFAFRRAAREEKGGSMKFYAPPEKLAREVAAPVLGNALAEMPKSEAAVLDLANAAYEVRAQRLGKQEFDETLYQQTLREVLGERTIAGEVYGGIVTQKLDTGFFSSAKHSIIIPPTVKQSKWDELRDTITAGDLDRAGVARPVDGGGHVMPMSAIRQGTLVPVGDSKYAVAMGDPSEPGGERWLMANPNADEKFILDLKALEPTLRKRRPDLFIGGE